jgi:cytochrome P450
MGDRALFPFPEFFWRISPKYPLEIAAKQANQRFTTACQEMIAYKRHQRLSSSQSSASQNIGGVAMIDAMLWRQRDDSARDALTDDEIIANVKTFYLAGADTSGMYSL